MTIDELDSIHYHNSQRKSGVLFFEGFPFNFHSYEFMLLDGSSYILSDTIESITYPTLRMHFLKEVFNSSDSIAERREIALIDTMSIPFDSGFAYVFWCSSILPRNYNTEEKLKWYSSTDKFYRKLKENLIQVE